MHITINNQRYSSFLDQFLSKDKRGAFAAAATLIYNSNDPVDRNNVESLLIDAKIAHLKKATANLIKKSLIDLEDYAYTTTDAANKLINKTKDMIKYAAVKRNNNKKNNNNNEKNNDNNNDNYNNTPKKKKNKKKKKRNQKKNKTTN